ncbi:MULTISPECIES: CheF family chemotaxis protein [unclassified Halorhabdus]|uniref:CheF family chemotaxis protein n=1 Tax=unclassified Halorhabdus TaxID=2621901 RepID=UPI0023D9F1CE|nr:MULTISPECIES: CheF family chemotaxis protein [unclassified Halorhabdus]WEL16809.1 Component of chemotaxis system associated with archaellum, contains CheF-like and HTH domain [Halorhabdus sp. SVX81]WEL20683.1 Component of chemotaxis system associated with archaellum, contains CheF-like and HTH domain [Halorhabdus sp. BNX81]
MSEEEQKILDVAGDYRQVRRDGQRVNDPDWQSSRIVLTDKRLVLAGNGSNRSLPHGRVTIPNDLDAIEIATDAIALRVGSTVIEISPTSESDFPSTYCRANLAGEVVLVNHPAVVGGVVQDDAEWTKARFSATEEEVTLTFPGGERVTSDFADVGTVETGTRSVMGETRPVVEIEHTDDDGRSVETHLSGTERHTSVLRKLFEVSVAERDDEYELTETESQVLMALYSGVSPFEMADFVGLSVDEVEEIYGKLLEVGAVDEVRTRTEVSLNAQGRNMASEAMNEQ